ncbi:MAG: universal stress protein [Ignavibacteriae bacterium]|nr:universal stress protein [Ignavibacteriota bacterium]
MLQNISRILIPIDFSDASKNTLKHGVAFAERFHAEVLLVYVIEPVIFPADFSFGQVAVPSMESEFRMRGEDNLARLLENEVLPRTTGRALVRMGKPFVEINRAAREEQADLIIIGTHGHTGIEHVLFGSTAEKVVRKAPCPVLVLREQDWRADG